MTNSMATDPQVGGWIGPSRRREPRFPLQSVLDVTVLRSGIPDTVPGRSVNVCESGIAAVLAQELVPGEAVAIEVQLSPATAPVRTRAIVRYQDKLSSGLEFLGLPVEQRDAIRKWAQETEAEARPAAVATRDVVGGAADRRTFRDGAGSGTPPPKKKHLALGLAILLALLLTAASLFWWRWSRGWEELEAGLKARELSSAEKPVTVPAEAMQKLLVHRVEPVYPAQARRENLQGIIALDIVVGREGSVVSMHPLNGPDVLARAAMDALRWWKFEPYRVNGQPQLVETTVAVEFKK